jgi:hypothetical protein
MRLAISMQSAAMVRYSVALVIVNPYHPATRLLIQCDYIHGSKSRARNGATYPDVTAILRCIFAPTSPSLLQSPLLRVRRLWLNADGSPAISVQLDGGNYDVLSFDDRARLRHAAPAQAQAAAGDPEIVIYRFPGVLDSCGAAIVGVATVFHCTNFRGVTETIRIVVRNFNTIIAANDTVSIAHLATVTAATHDTAPYGEDKVLNTGAIAQGTAAIAATSINVICTAMTIDAANSKPDGVSLRGIRFSPVPGSQE